MSWLRIGDGPRPAGLLELRIVDGVPQCPLHHEPMTEAPVNLWACAKCAATVTGAQ